MRLEFVGGDDYDYQHCVSYLAVTVGWDVDTFFPILGTIKARSKIQWSGKNACTFHRITRAR